MYTRCPQCSTIFRVTAAQLRIALGEVSCGSCHTTFNALNALSDELPELTEAVVLNPIDTSTGDELQHDDQAEDSTEDILIDAAEGEDAAEEIETIVVDTTEVGDNLIDIFDDDAVEGERSGAATDEAAAEVEAPPPEPDDVHEAAIFDYPDNPAEFAAGDEVEETAATAAEASADEPAEPLYDDDTGYEEVLTVVDREDYEETPREEDTANTWAGILAAAGDQDRHEERREPEEIDRTTGDDAGPSHAAVEPAYDDNTGIEEALAEGEIAAPDIGDDSASPPEHGDTLEFDAPEQAWPKIFSPTEAWPPVATSRESGDEDGAEPAAPPDLATLSPLASETTDTDEWAGFLAELTPADSTTDEFAPELPDEDDDGPVFVLGNEDEVAAVVDAPDTAEIETDPLIDYEPEFVPPWESEPAEDDAVEAPWKRPSNRHIAIAAALVCALGVQLLHYNRDSIAAHPSWGQPLRTVYGALGQELYPEWDLAAYRISGSEAVAGRTAPAVLDVLANVVVGGEHAVGMPMIRVALRDRWSNTVASRVFSPQEYLRDFDTRPALVSPGTTLPVEISVADPGAEAHGYVVDVCVPRRTSGLQCQNATDPLQQQ